jgi:hypothetical protein
LRCESTAKVHFAISFHRHLISSQIGVIATGSSKLNLFNRLRGA